MTHGDGAPLVCGVKHMTDAAKARQNPEAGVIPAQPNQFKSHREQTGDLIVAIETSENLEQQQEIPTLSKEEQLTELFNIRVAIAEKQEAIESLKAHQKGIKSQIDKLEIEEVQLLQRLGSGQIILNVQAPDNSEPDEEEYPSDEELAEFDEDDELEAEEEGPKLLTGEVAEAEVVEAEVVESESE